MTSVSLKYRRIDGVTADGVLVTSGLVEVVPAYRRDTGTGQMTTIGDTYPVGSTIVLAPGTYLFKLRASDGKGGRVKDEGVYRLVPASGTFDVDDLAEVTPTASGMTISDVQALIDAAISGVTPGPGGTPTGSGPGGLFYSVDVKDTSTVGRAVMTGDAAAGRSALGAGTSSLVIGTTAGTAAEGDDLVTLAGTVTTLSTTVAGKASTTSPTISNPTITGTADLVNLDVSGTTVFAADSIAQAAVNGLTTALSGKVSATSPTVSNLTGTGTTDLVNLDVSGTVVIPDDSITVAKLSDIETYLTSTWGQLPTIWATSATTWPATRTVPAGYSGAVRWDSSAFNDAVAPPGVAVAGDRWRRRRPTA